MASNIDPSVPVFGNPTTASVRSNFAVAKQEISTLQTTTVPINVTGTLVIPTVGNVLVALHTAAGPLSVTLPPGNYVGQTLFIKDVDGQAGTNNVGLIGAAIDGNPSYALMSGFASVTVVWLGTMWGTI